nr:MAG TPA: virion morphogenesis protein [Caudoviricetes sp.]
MLTISLDSSQLERGLGQLLHNLTRRKAVNAAIAAELLSLTEDNFENEGWGGQRWKPTQRGGKILQLSGQLAGSISTSATNSFARIGSNKKYAAIHHLGGKAGRGRKVTIPARPYLPINGSGQLQPGGEQRILEVVKDALVQGL